ncbi:MAG: hypothetical protein EPN91_01760 [Salinibacterium sp.]|nr:MAG: hypothetical protein EPN91_01760 [Salinibacterium sp.]
MKFMIMLFDDRSSVHSRSAEAIERMVSFTVRLDDELAQSGELVYSEVLDDDGTLIAPYGSQSHGNGTPLSRYWVVKVAEKARALEIARGLAEAVDAPIEVRRCLESSLRP